jgi:RND family efflux transporter MFP subunit
MLSGSAWVGNAISAETQIIAKVKTAMISQRVMSEDITGFGTVTTGTGQEVSIAMPRAGQLTGMNVMPGQFVKQGETLALFATAAADTLAYKQAVLDESYAKDEFERSSILFTQTLLTNAQLAVAQKALETAEANLAAQKKLNSEQIEESIKAPFDGVVTATTAAKGDYLPAGGLILKVAKPSRVSVQVGIEPGEAARVRPGMPVKIISLTDQTNTATATVNAVYGIVNPQTRLINAQVNLDGSSKFFLGEKLQAEIRVQSSKCATVPRAAVLTDSAGSYVFQIAHGLAKRVSVKTTQEDDRYIAVSGVLDITLPVVTLGNYELEDGMKVMVTR